MSRKYTKIQNEVWLPVVGYVGFYEVSNKGRVRSLDRKWLTKNAYVKGRVLKPNFLNRFGYLQVFLSGKGKQRACLVHRLVLSAFVGPCPEGMECCHFPDRNPQNNRLENLRWDTIQGNRADSKIHGTQVILHGERGPSAKLTNSKVRKIRYLYATGNFTQKELAVRFRVVGQTISCIINWITWKHLSVGEGTKRAVLEAMET